MWAEQNLTRCRGDAGDFQAGRAAPRAGVAGVEAECGVGGETGKPRRDLGDPRRLPGGGLHQIHCREGLEGCGVWKSLEELRQEARGREEVLALSGQRSWDTQVDGSQSHSGGDIGRPGSKEEELQAPSLSLSALLSDSSSTASHWEGFTNTHPSRRSLWVPKVFGFHVNYATSHCTASLWERP